MESVEETKEKSKELLEITKKLNEEQKQAVLYIATGMLLNSQSSVLNQKEANV